MATEDIEHKIEGLRKLVERALGGPDAGSAACRELLTGLEHALEELQVLEEGRAAAAGAAAREAARYQALFELAPDACLVTDAHGRIREANREAAALLGLSPQALAGKPLVLFVDPLDREAFHRHLAALRRHPCEAPLRLGLRPQGGEAVPAEASTADAGGDGAFLWSFRELSGRLRSEEALAESEERYRLLFESSLDAVLLTEPDGTVLDANPAACRVFGHGVEELRRVGRAGVVDPSDPRLAAALEERRLTGRFSGELRLRRGDRSAFSAEVTSVVFRDSRGRERTWLVVRDLTERKRAEQALRESEEKYRRLVETAHDLIWSVDAEGRITFINEACRQIYGREPEEMIGRPYTDFIPPGQAEANVREMELALGGDDPVSHFENWVLRREGTPVLLSANAELLRDERGRVLGSMGTSRDITEERGRQEELRRSREWFAAVFHASPIPMGYGRLDSGELLEVNERYAQFFGYTPAELRGRSAPELWADPAQRREVVRRVHAEGRVRDLEAAFRHRSGEVRHGLLSMEVLPSDGESLVLAAVVDIAERKRAEEALRLSEETFRGAFEEAAVGMAVMGADGRFLRANLALQRMLGYDEDTLRERTFADVTHPEDRDAGRGLFLDLLRGVRTSAVLEKRYLRRDGAVMWARLSTAAIRTPSGELVHLVSQIEDTTAQRRAEEALRRSEALFRELWEHMGTGVAVYEPAPDGEDFLFLDLNRAGERTARASREEVRGRRLLDCFPGARALGLWDLLWEVRRTGVPGRLPANRYEDARHSYWVENYVYRLPSGEVVAMFEDVTARREAEEALRHRAEEVRRLGSRLQQLEAEERRRLAGELHDQVGQNLTALGISLRILEAELGPACGDRARRRLEDCQELIDQIGSRIRDVMAELRPLALEDFGLRAGLRGQCVRFTERTGVACAVDGDEFHPRLPPEVESALFRVAQEALANTAKHAGATRVAVCLEEEGGACRVTVADDGAGFAPGGAGAASDRAGWGLSLMAERMEAVGGRLTVDAAPGRGTRVVAEVTRATQAAAGPLPARDSSARMPGP